MQLLMRCPFLLRKKMHLFCPFFFTIAHFINLAGIGKRKCQKGKWEYLRLKGKGKIKYKGKRGKGKCKMRNENR